MSIATCVLVQVVKGTIRDTRQKVTNLVENNEYQYRVCAVNKAGAGNYSEGSDLYKAYDPIGTAVTQRHTTSSFMSSSLCQGLRMELVTTFTPLCLV